MDTIDVIAPGDRVSWKSKIPPYTRFFGKVLVAPVTTEYYHVRTDKRVPLLIHRSRITKEGA